MGAAKERICSCCGKSEMTASKAPICAECHNEARRKAKRQEEKEYIEALGYDDVQYVGMSVHLKPEWRFTHECGATQIWVYGNIVKRVKEDPDIVPCSSCGGKRRTKNGTAVSAENRKIKNPEGWPDYKLVTRRLSENTYAQYKSEINPLDLRRGHGAYHLDHIMSIAEGWELGHTPEYMARKENLQMLTSKENLSKGRK